MVGSFTTDSPGLREQKEAGVTMAYLATRFVAGRLKESDWIADAEVRLREEGQLYSGETFVVPSAFSDLTERIEDALERTRELDWRNYDLTMIPVRSLHEGEER